MSILNFMGRAWETGACGIWGTRSIFKIMAVPALSSISERLLHTLNQEDVSDKDRWEILAEGFAQIEKTYPGSDDSSAGPTSRVTEFRLIREIEGIKKETADVRKETEGLKVEVEGLKKETAALKVEVEGLKKETAALKVEVEGLKKETAALKIEVKGLKVEVRNLDLKIAETKTELIKEIAETKLELTREIAETKAELTEAVEKSRSSTLKWMVGLFIAFGALNAAGIFGAMLTLANILT